MSMSTLAARIGTTLVALWLVVGLAGTASAMPSLYSADGSTPTTTDDCYPGDGHSWH